MKIKTTLSLFLFSFLGLSLFSQTEKVLEPGTAYLNDMIVGDTASDGTRQATIYVLKRDSEYLVSGPFENHGWKLHMKAEDGSGNPPIVRVYPDGEGNIPWAMIYLHGDLEIEGLLIDGRPSDAEQPPVSWPFVSNSEGATLVIENCIFMNGGQGGFGVWNAAKSVKINNCKFYNMGNISTSDLGNGRLVDCRSSEVDELIVTNNTIVNSIDRVVRHRGGSGVIKKLVFDHNTIVNNASYHGFIELGNVGTSVQITNNLMIDAMTLGADQTDVTRLSELDAHGETDGSGNPLMVWIGSIPNDSTTYTISKNFYSVSSEIQAFYTAESVDEGPDQLLTDHIKGKLGTAAAEALVKKEVTLANIPGSLAAFCSWYYSPDGANKQKVTTTDVDYDKKTIDYWLNSLDCGYVVTNDLLGTDGIAAGDTNWKAKTTNIFTTNSETTELTNYPNPFTLSTTLQFTLKSSSEVTIDICDVTGRCVNQIDAGYYSSGLNSITIHKENLSSGIYFIKLKAGTQVGMKKIIIM